MAYMLCICWFKNFEAFFMQVKPDGAFLLKRMCEVITAKKRYNSSWIAELSTLWYIGFQPLILLSYNFIQFD